MKWHLEAIGGPEALASASASYVPCARYYVCGEPTLYTIGFVLDDRRVTIGTPACYRPFTSRVPARDWRTVTAACVAVAWYLENEEWDATSHGASVAYRRARGNT